jgi:hypothetical protein
MEKKFEELRANGRLDKYMQKREKKRNRRRGMHDVLEEEDED